MSTLTTKLVARILASQTGTGDLQIPSAPLNLSKAIELAAGTGANQADVLWSDTRILTASSTENLDLNGTGLTNALGETASFVKVRGLYVAAAAANTNTVNVGGAASNGFITPFGDATDVLKVRPGGFVFLAAPDTTAYAVTAATGDLLKIANGGAGTSVTYDIVLVGASA